jgi:integrase
VPLTDRALDILRAQQQVVTGQLIFEGGKEGAAISDTAMVKALRAAGAGDATLHGLRSSFRDWCGDATSHPRDVAEAALAHAVGDAVERAYRRGDALDKRRMLMDDWGTYCASKVGR